MKITKTLAATLVAVSLSGCGTEYNSYIVTDGLNDESTLYVIDNYKNTIFYGDNVTYVTDLLHIINGSHMVSPYKARRPINQRNIEIQKLELARQVVEGMDVSDDTKEKYADFIDYYVNLYKKNQAFEDSLTEERIQELVYEKYPEFKELVDFREQRWGNAFVEARTKQKELIKIDKEVSDAYSELVANRLKMDREIYLAIGEMQLTPYQNHQRDINEGKPVQSYSPYSSYSTQPIGSYMFDANSDGTCADFEIKTENGDVIGTVPSLKTVDPDRIKSGHNQCQAFSYVENWIEVNDYTTPEFYKKMLDLQLDTVKAMIKYHHLEDLRYQAEVAVTRSKHQIRYTDEDQLAMEKINYRERMNKMLSIPAIADLYDSGTNSFLRSSESFVGGATSSVTKGFVAGLKFLKAMSGEKDELNFNARAYFEEHPDQADLFTPYGVSKLLTEDAKNILAKATKIEVGEDGGTPLKLHEYMNVPKMLAIKTDDGEIIYSAVSNTDETAADANGETKVTMYTSHKGSLLSAVYAVDEMYSNYDINAVNLNEVISAEINALNEAKNN
ncbi:hypothetical protein VST7929_01710 [Vibrio stylophorae]|uniref:Uncharacterized protein n=2 Tax=Vibrio stylophorae TaxID=659351 RepID=A0ABN8DV80_9VIBR|nr:hypothetical protein VST7929_01710 [Vibrio stylophorae]